MQWKPAAPVYPRLVQRVPEGLTLEEATEMRSKGRKLPVICKLGKNGLYCNLVNNVREAFEECELVRINCQGMNKSDYKKIGAKLKDLVPCVLITFEQEHILVWRGRDWKCSLPVAKDSTHSTVNDVVFSSLDESETDDGLETQELTSTKARSAVAADEASTISVTDAVANENAISEQDVVFPYIGTDGTDNQFMKINNGESCGAQADRVVGMSDDHIIDAKSNVSKVPLEEKLHASASNGDAFIEWNEDALRIIGDNHLLETTGSDFNGMKIDEITRVSEDQREDASSIVFDIVAVKNVDKSTQPNKIHAKGLLLFLQGAIDSGCAVVLGQSDFMVANIVYKRSVDLAKTAPPGPTFRQKTKKLPVNKNKEQDKPVFVQPLTSQTSSEKRQSSRIVRNNSFSSDCDV